MKKISKILALIFAFALALSVVSCNTIKDGSVITTVKLTVDFYDANGEVADTNVVTLELYSNNSPKTVKHVKSLIKSGHYNGTNISLVGTDSQKGFVQFGGYYYKDGVLTEKEYKGKTIEGEFANNGWGNQKLTASSGSVVLRHDFYSKDGGNQYDTGKATLMIMLGGLVDVSKDNFCVIGKVMTDDGASELTSSVSDIDDTERSSLSSFRIINSIHDLRIETESTDVETKKTTLFYNEVTGEYVLKVSVTDDSSTTVTSYYKGTEIDEENKMTDTEVDEFNDLFSIKGSGGMEDHFYDWQVLPYRNVIIRSAKIK